MMRFHKETRKLDRTKISLPMNRIWMFLGWMKFHQSRWISTWDWWELRRSLWKLFCFQPHLVNHHLWPSSKPFYMTCEVPSSKQIKLYVALYHHTNPFFELLSKLISQFLLVSSINQLHFEQLLPMHLFITQVKFTLLISFETLMELYRIFKGRI